MCVCARLECARAVQLFWLRCSTHTHTQLHTHTDKEHGKTSKTRQRRDKRRGARVEGRCANTDDDGGIARARAAWVCALVPARARAGSSEREVREGVHRLTRPNRIGGGHRRRQRPPLLLLLLRGRRRWRRRCRRHPRRGRRGTLLLDTHLRERCERRQSGGGARDYRARVLYTDIPERASQDKSRQDKTRTDERQNNKWIQKGLLVRQARARAGRTHREFLHS